jgi:hypothetical protein
MTQLNKIIKLVLDEQSTSPGVAAARLIAKKIYNAKGIAWDDEFAALQAILSIKDITQFNLVQKELQKLSGGKGIAQFVSEFIVVRDSMNAEYAPTTIRYIKSIIAHLTNIGAYKQTINIFNEKLKWITNWSKVNANLASKGAGQTQFAWETFAEKAAVDPEFKHNYLTSLQILATFIPVIGWIVSAEIGLGNAYVYYQEGDTKQAGLEAIFAAIPGLGFASKLGLSKIAPKVMAGLGKKLALNQTKNLTKQEIRILDILGKNQKALKTELDNYFKTGIAKSAKQLSRDKIAAATKKYGIGLAKTSGTLASYMTIAKLYSDVYDANAPQITDSELLALNNKLDADFERWLATRYRSKISDGIVQTNNTKLNEAPIDALNFIINNPATSAVYAAAASAVIIAFSKRLRSLLIKLPLVKQIPAMYNDLRDRNFLIRNGLKEAGQIKQLYKSGEMLSTYEDIWRNTEAAVKRGEMTPQEAMKSIKFIKTPGTAKLTFKQLTAYYDDAVRTKGMVKSAASAKAVAATPKTASAEFEKFIMSSDPTLSAIPKATPKVDAALTAVQDIPVRKWVDWEKAHAKQGDLARAIETLDARSKQEYKLFKWLVGVLTGVPIGLWGLMKVYQSSDSKSTAKANWPEFKKWLDIRNMKPAEIKTTTTTKKKPTTVPTTTKAPVVRTDIDPTDTTSKASNAQAPAETEDQFTGFQ